MGKVRYLMSSGELKRKDDSILFETAEGKRYIPVETTDEFLVFGEVTLNKRFLEFATKMQIILHFFNHYGYYQGSYYPREHLNAGAVILAQAREYSDEVKRLALASQFLAGALQNMEKVLRYYAVRKENPSLDVLSENIQIFFNSLREAKSVAELMAFEGNAREIYYKAFDHIVQQESFAFGNRTRRPPGNPMNALISFLNSLCYILALSQIYRTHLDPRIGYLHETNFRRFSLNLDLSEIFKPLLVDRTIFSLLNKKELRASHFSTKGEGVYLGEKGREIVIQAWEERLKSTIDHPRLKRKVSYRGLVRMEAYKIEKHILGDEEYRPFVTRW